jgi:hypothetical protein
MKALLHITLLLSLLTFTQCKAKKESVSDKSANKETPTTQAQPQAPDSTPQKAPEKQAPNNEPQVNEKVVSDEEVAVRYKVSFFSRGAGIDRATHKAFEELVNKYNDSGNCKLNYFQKSWGKEGERDYCFLNSDDPCVEKFVTEAKAIIAKSDQVRSKENTTCKK